MNKPSRIAETHRLDLGRRPRRNRKAEWARRLVAEPILTTNDLVWPLFQIDGEKPRSAGGMTDNGLRLSLRRPGAPMNRRFDAIVIGAGQAGPPMAGRIAATGKTVALIERKLIGGTCVNTGCTPTKTLVASAYAAHLARRAGDFGVSAGPVGVDFAAVMARKDKVVGDSRSSLEAWLRGWRTAPSSRVRPASCRRRQSGSATMCSKPSASSSTSAAARLRPISQVAIR